MMRPSRKSTHETGHMFGLLDRGLPAIEMKLLPAGSFDGLTIHDIAFGSADPDEVLCVALAGPAAEAYIHGVDEHEAQLAMGASADLAFVRMWLDAIAPSTTDANAIYQRAARKAKHLAMVYAPLISLVATELDRRRTLSADDVRALIQQHQEANSAHVQSLRVV